MRLDNYGLADISEWLRAHVAALTARHEAGRENEWKVTDAPTNFIDAQLRGIVGIELHVATRLRKSEVEPEPLPRGSPPVSTTVDR